MRFGLARWSQGTLLRRWCLPLVGAYRLLELSTGLLANIGRRGNLYDLLETVSRGRFFAAHHIQDARVTLRVDATDIMQAFGEPG